MKKFYLILKILLILAVLITLGYLATTPDSEVILKRPWLDKTSDVDYGVPWPAWEVYKGDKKVLGVSIEDLL